MTPQQFVAKWSQILQKETAVSQSHFNDLCALVGHKPPIAYDPEGQNFSFETQAVKPDGSKGFADVFYRDKFIWEYKGPHKDLDRAYRQLQLYRESLHNPPLPAGVIDVAYEKRLKARTLTNLYNGLVYYRATTRHPISQRNRMSDEAATWDEAQFRKVTRKSATRSEIQELDDIHTALDNAVLDAYGWPHNLTDEEILERLLALNLERAGA
jgi:hypothetical protein